VGALLNSYHTFAVTYADPLRRAPPSEKWSNHGKSFRRPYIALQSLLTEEGAIQTTSNNIANVNTPGYARNVRTWRNTPPVQLGHLTFGSGVELQHVTSLRDSILDLRVNQETQQQGKLNAFLGSAQQIQALFNETSGTGLQSSLTAFFSSVSQLSANPSD